MKQNHVALIGLIYLIALPVTATDSHCHEQESIIFSCSLGKNIVSVCASKEISPTSGYLQYRFGQKNAPELIFPSSTTPSNRLNIQAGTLMFSGGGGSYLRFINGQYNYIVYTAIGKGWGTKDGVAVEKNGKNIANLTCHDVPISLLSDEFFNRAELKREQDEFLLP